MGEQSTRYRYTDYFLREVLRKRPYLRPDWCEYVIENAVRCEVQENNRIRFWARVPEMGDRYLRVVTFEDKVTNHGAIPDRRFSP